MTVKTDNSGGSVLTTYWWYFCYVSLININQYNHYWRDHDTLSCKYVQGSSVIDKYNKLWIKLEYLNKVTYDYRIFYRSI